MSMRGKTIYEELCFSLHGIYWMFAKLKGSSVTHEYVQAQDDSLIQSYHTRWNLGTWWGTEEYVSDRAP